MDEKKVTEEQKVEIVMDDLGNTVAKPLAPQIVTTEEALEIITAKETPEPQPEAQLTPEKKENKPIEEPRREVGRPCDFCENRTKIMQKVLLYAEYCEGKVDGSPHVPYLQELCGYDYLDILTTQLWGWVNSKTHEAEHLELSNTIKKIMERQQLRLLQRSLAAQNPAGAIFQLKANHGMVETEKTLVGGIKGGEPMDYNIHIVPKSKKQMELEESDE